MSQGLKRIATAAVGIPLVLGLVWAGGWYFFGFIVVVALGAQFELLDMLRKAGWDVRITWSLLIGASLFLRHVVPVWEANVLIVVLLFCVFQLRSGPDHIQERISGGILTALYPVFFLSFLIDIHLGAAGALGSESAFWLILLLLCLIWATDTGAYYTGKTFGKHKFAPSISPNKTWEGTLGGLALACVVAAAFKETLLPDLTWLDAGILALLGGGWGQMGDLFESAFKRSCGVKDSGTLLPGHGGVLDLFDSLIFTAPAYYLYLSQATSLLGG